MLSVCFSVALSAEKDEGSPQLLIFYIPQARPQAEACPKTNYGKGPRQSVVGSSSPKKCGLSRYMAPFFKEKTAAEISHVPDGDGAVVNCTHHTLRCFQKVIVLIFQRVRERKWPRN